MMVPPKGVAGNSEGWPSFLIVGLEGPAGIEAALALAEAGNCSVTLGDDKRATADWRTIASCLLLETRSRRQDGVDRWDGGPPPAAVAMRRSQFLATVLNNCAVIKKGTARVRALSPIGDASVVDGFEAVIMGDPALPHAIAFNEHCRAVGCGFILAEARGAVGRLFHDPGGLARGAASSRSLRECIIYPRFPTCHRSHSINSSSSNREAVSTINPTPPPRETPTLRPHSNNCSAREHSGVALSERAMREERGGVGEVVMSCREAQLHVCFQALHAFLQEHGHMPVSLGRDQAEEVVRIAEEIVEAGHNVPAEEGLVSQKPVTIDAALCGQVAALARVPVPAVGFQLGGLAAATVLRWATSRRRDNGGGCGGGSGCSPKEGNTAPTRKVQYLNRDNERRGQWFMVDELGAGYGGSGPQEERAQRSLGAGAAVDPPPLEAWIGKVEGATLGGARLALIGCGRLGRDVARCLALTGVCAGSRGRLVLIDHGDAFMPSRQRGAWIADDGAQGRATALQEQVSSYAGCNLHASAFDGPAQDTDGDMDLWEGVDAVIICAGRGGYDAAAAAEREAGAGVAGGCEALVRFVSHKCVLHRKPLVWGWAGGLGKWGGGVEVMSPGRTSCLVCSSQGMVKELVDRRTTLPRKRPDDSAEKIPGRPRDVDAETCDQQDHHDLSVARATIAGLVTAELIKLLRPRCPRTDLRNWTLGGGGGGGGCRGGSHRVQSSGGIANNESGEMPSQTNAPDATLGLGQSHAASCFRLGKIPDPPRVVCSTTFDPFSGDSVRAIPEGFTEWGVEEISPPRDAPTTSNTCTRVHRTTAGSGTAVDHFSLRSLAQIVLARFGVDIKSVAAAEPGSECRAGGREGGGWTAAASGGVKLLWAEWEKVEGGDGEQTIGRGRVAVPKMDRKVIHLWKEAVKTRTIAGERDGRPISSEAGAKEPRFLFLDVNGVIGGQNATIPILKYWVR